ncbi:hypothetical protein SPRG_04002 [Saprolegnia parasitica CBS 223.65]|uniref:Intron-binding protein aquarius N-terminal domain-containing protein n=1 Tax=Saprolegnia parasitica (strain CBS 223.65) TaxID=695850 RepID=A0A067CQ61_SAPPC|nr:hypothetical protein SPRG_04002 [Saprolegnia parasitica CBS 223.65]KDO31385.1 hypothetical protein SPRG_04002 [Saprolegnia parasitica CBS 223.65]|eukprot:XP_012197982.1 hypothetical protein SPRG_04002 [Saprolegnia parasitica CBS 223.65]
MVRKTTPAMTASLDELAARWAPAAKDSTYDAAMVAGIYATHLAQADAASARATLDTTGYLERYLWPHFSEKTATDKALLLSIAITSNEKEGRNWASVDGATFGLFVDALLRLKMEADDLSLVEHTYILRFLMFGIRQLETSHVARAMLKYTSLPVWAHLSEVQRSLAFADHPKLKRHWQNRVQAKAPSSPAAKKRKTTVLDLEADFYASLIDDCKACLCSNDEAAVEYLVHSLNLFVDLLSQLPTRRFLRTLLLHRHLLLACRQSHWVTQHELLAKQAELLHFYAHFPIDDQTGHAWTTVEHKNELAARAHALQLAAFEQSPALHPLSLLPVAQLGDRTIVRQQLAPIPHDVLRPFCIARGLVHEKDDDDVDLVECFVDFFSQYTPPSLQSLPLYPTETDLWASDLASLDGVLPTRKLNLQFLSVTDYLLRCYELYRLEAASAIARDLERVIDAMAPTLTPGNTTMFRSRHPMGLGVEHVRVVRVGKPAIGESHPAQVVAHINLDLGGQSPEVLAAWDSLQPRDVVFLAGVQAVETMASPTLNAAERLGIHVVRGAQVLEVLDSVNKTVGELLENGRRYEAKGSRRTLRVALDGAQYAADLAAGGTELYARLNVLVRRVAEKNHFRSVLSTMQEVLQTQRVQHALPSWLNDVFLGYGDPSAAHYRQLRAKSDETLHLYDTFVDGDHALASFTEPVSLLDEGSGKPIAPAAATAPFRLTSTEAGLVLTCAAKPDDAPAAKGLRYTPAQVEAIRSGVHDGLTLVTGAPGTGKTDVAAQILANLYRSQRSQRIVVVAPTPAAVADLGAKLLALDVVDPGHMASLSATTVDEHDLSVAGRVTFLLLRREALLAQVDSLASALNLAHLGASHSCAQAQYFYASHVRPTLAHLETNDALRAFCHATTADAMQAYLDQFFGQLETLGALEILRTPKQRGDYVLVKHARVVLMTAADAANARARLLEMGFQYATLVVDAAAQVPEVDALAPLVLQKDASKLRRVVLLGDDKALPPALQNAPLAAFSQLNQSLLLRLVRLGAPVVHLASQGRTRPSLARLYASQYPGLSDLPCVAASPGFQRANPGFAFSAQFIDAPRATAVNGENRVEAMWMLQLFQYMRHVGIAATAISVLTATEAQKTLLLTMFKPHEATLGRPAHVATIDESVGAHSPYVLLSLVHTTSVGALRDVRRIVAAVSRAALGLYIVGKKALFEACVDLTPVLGPLFDRPTQLQLLPNERVATCSRLETDEAAPTTVQNAHELHEALAAMTLSD